MLASHQGGYCRREGNSGDRSPKAELSCVFGAPRGGYRDIHTYLLSCSARPNGTSRQHHEGGQATTAVIQQLQTTHRSSERRTRYGPSTRASAELALNCRTSVLPGPARCSVLPAFFACGGGDRALAPLPTSAAIRSTLRQLLTRTEASRTEMRSVGCASRTSERIVSGRPGRGPGIMHVLNRTERTSRVVGRARRRAGRGLLAVLDPTPMPAQVSHGLAALNWAPGSKVLPLS